jgi:hypothetical protein
MKNISLLFSFLFVLSCSNDSPDDLNNDDNNDGTPVTDYEVWTGANITFTKAANSDAGLAANQDRITTSVAITRGTSGGEIFNAVTESDATKNVSPRATKWAVGNIADLESLSFSSFRTAVGKPKNVVGKNLVMYIEADNVYLSVKFLSWASSQSGGFSYERSTKD